MTTFAIFLAAFLLGIVAGLRTFTPLAAVSWGAFLGALSLHGSWLGFLGSRITVGLLTAAALFELVVDQLPSTPSRKMPPMFIARLASGALCGAAVGVAGGSWVLGLVLGIAGAFFGTLGGAEARSHLAHSFHRDRPAAFLEDAIAIAGAVFSVAVLA